MKTNSTLSKPFLWFTGITSGVPVKNYNCTANYYTNLGVYYWKSATTVHITLNVETNSKAHSAIQHIPSK